MIIKHLKQYTISESTYDDKNFKILGYFSTLYRKVHYIGIHYIGIFFNVILMETKQSAEMSTLYRKVHYIGIHYTLSDFACTGKVRFNGLQGAVKKVR